MLMFTFTLTALASAPLLAAGQDPSAASAPDAAASIGDLAAQICPSDAETKWLAIPWRVSFWQGVQDSQIEGKPILLWAMNGHPLGCT